MTTHDRIQVDQRRSRWSNAVATTCRRMRKLFFNVYPTPRQHHTYGWKNSYDLRTRERKPQINTASHFSRVLIIHFCHFSPGTGMTSRTAKRPDATRGADACAEAPPGGITSRIDDKWLWSQVGWGSKYLRTFYRYCGPCAHTSIRGAPSQGFTRTLYARRSHNLFPHFSLTLLTQRHTLLTITLQLRLKNISLMHVDFAVWSTHDMMENIKLTN